MVQYFLDSQGNKTTDPAKGVTLINDNPGAGADFTQSLPTNGLFRDPTDNAIWASEGGKLYEVTQSALQGSTVDTSTLPTFEFGQIVSPSTGFVKAGTYTDPSQISQYQPASGTSSFSNTPVTTGAIQNTPEAIGALQGKTPQQIAAEQAAIKASPGYGASSTVQAASWYDPATGQPTPVGVGAPKPSVVSPPAGATYISDPKQLAGLKETDIWRDSNGRIYDIRKSKATLTSPTSQKKVVTIGSPEASQLLGSGWTLGDKVGGGTITSSLLTPETDLNIAKGTNPNTYAADTAAASAAATSTAVDEELARLQKLLTPPETTLSKQVNDLMAQIGTGAESLTGRGAAQLAEEEKRGIEVKSQALASKNTLLKQKLAEINALTASYDQANQSEEGRPQTLSRLQGAQAQNYKMFLAQKSLLTSEAGFIESELLGIQGELQAAQAAANRAVDLLYMDRESSYNAKIAQLNVLLPQLEKEEARYGQAVQIYLQQQATALAEEKQNKKDIQGVLLQVIANNPAIARDRIIDQIKNAGSVVEAMQIAGQLATGSGWQYVTTPEELTKLRNAGYETINLGGRIYAKPPEKVKGSGSGGNNSSGFNEKTAIADMNGVLSGVVDSTGRVTEAQWNAARSAWAKEGGNVTTFDTKFRGYKPTTTTESLDAQLKAVGYKNVEEIAAYKEAQNAASYSIDPAQFLKEYRASKESTGDLF